MNIAVAAASSTRSDSNDNNTTTIRRPALGPIVREHLNTSISPTHPPKSINATVKNPHATSSHSIISTLRRIVEGGAVNAVGGASEGSGVEVLVL